MLLFIIYAIIVIPFAINFGIQWVTTGDLTYLMYAILVTSLGFNFLDLWRSLFRRI